MIKKLRDQITSCAKLVNDLSSEVKLVWIKGLTKGFINGYSNDAKFFPDNCSQNHSVFQPLHRYL